jgi:large subunit ribosomal protein L3
VIIGALGNKIGMTQIFDKSGNVVPVTVIRIGPCVITQIKTSLNDGYNAIQVGYGNLKSKSVKQPQLGHLRKLNLPPLKYFQEYKIDSTENFDLGQLLTINLFKLEKFVNISSISSGKGFAGSHKRHNFDLGPRTHGSKNYRAPGSIGMGTTPGRVFPGKKMPGQLGNKQVTIQKLEIIQINLDENILVVKGSVPGKPGALVNATLIR